MAEVKSIKDRISLWLHRQAKSENPRLQFTYAEVTEGMNSTFNSFYTIKQIRNNAQHMLRTGDIMITGEELKRIDDGRTFAIKLIGLTKFNRGGDIAAQEDVSDASNSNVPEDLEKAGTFDRPGERTDSDGCGTAVLDSDGDCAGSVPGSGIPLRDFETLIDRITKMGVEMHSMSVRMQGLGEKDEAIHLLLSRMENDAHDQVGEVVPDFKALQGQFTDLHQKLNKMHDGLLIEDNGYRNGYRDGFRDGRESQ